MPLSVIDVVLKHGDPVQIGGATPLGLLAPIVHQPHLGEDREQVFAIAGAEGQRLLAWRTAMPGSDGQGATRFVVRALSADEWRDLLDERLSVPRVLADDGPAARVTLARGAESGGVTVEPTTVRTELPVDALPPESVTTDDGKEQRHRAAWLGLVKGTVLSPDNDDHADDLATVERQGEQAPSLEATAEDGSTLAAHGSYVVTVAPDETRTVRRYRRQIDALLAVERAGLR
ncbi:MAG: hypothetical protein M0P31_10960 [Solirubrobacteraceae bacterium]|nr:hypothetical protein [Solirubrobacteraceae bacterium]